LALQDLEKPCWQNDWVLSLNLPLTIKPTKPHYKQGSKGVLDKTNLTSKRLKNKNRMQTNDKTYTPLSPILPLKLSVKKPKDSNKYPKEIVTIGNEFKQARLDRNLTQLEVAKQLKVNKNFVTELENNKRILTIFALHKACSFLGYVPKTLKIDISTLQGKLFVYRIKNNLNYSNLSKQINLDKGTLSNFEKSGNSKIATINIIKEFFKKNY